ncbi:hypothetical protein HY061_02385 [Candidatus Azambacteria bacterium]|nr:hypothetical protein [Candidatus Azambacteria bacterium]
MKLVKENNRRIILKTIFFWVGISSLVLGSYFLFKSKNTVLSKSNNSNKDIASLESVGKRDYNGDSLKDWQKVLLKINPIDTNKNGIINKEEIAKSENSKDDQSIKVTTSNSVDKSNSTNYLAKQLAQQMVDSNLDPKTMSPQDILKNLSSKDLSELDSLGLSYEPTKFKESDFQKIPTTKQNVLNYLKELDKIISEGRGENDETFANALKTKDFSEVKIIINEYQKNINDLKKIEIPDKFSTLHMELLNILSLIKFGLESFTALEIDPVKSYMGLETYNRVIKIGFDFPQKLIDQLNKLYSPK